MLLLVVERWEGWWREAELARLVQCNGIGLFVIRKVAEVHHITRGSKKRYSGWRKPWGLGCRLWRPRCDEQPRGGRRHGARWKWERGRRGHSGVAGGVLGGNGSGIRRRRGDRSGLTGAASGHRRISEEKEVPHTRCVAEKGGLNNLSVLALLLLRGKTEEKRQDNGISKVRIRLYLTSPPHNPRTADGTRIGQPRKETRNLTE